MHSCPITWLAHFLAGVGAINWGLFAFLKFNLVEYLATLLPIPFFAMIIYGLVAIAGFYTIGTLFCKSCGTCK